MQDFGPESISFESASFVRMPERSHTQRAILPLVKLLGGQARAIGTCFSISNDGLCLTARHVIEDAFPEVVRTGRPMTDEDGWIYALYASPEPAGEGSEHDLGGLLPINKVFFMDRVDIAAVHISLPVHTQTGERLPMPAHRLGLSPPAVGSQCLAIGYHAMNWSGDPSGHRFEQSYSATRGLVEEVHVPFRDSYQLNFPCFRLSARFDGGMSGGPVMTEDGFVRGVVCSAFEWIDGKTYTSYASLVAPAMLLQIESMDRPGGSVATRFLWDFVIGGAVLADAHGVDVARGTMDCSLRIGQTVLTNAFAAEEAPK